MPPLPIERTFAAEFELNVQPPVAVENTSPLIERLVVICGWLAGTVPVNWAISVARLFAGIAPPAQFAVFSKFVSAGLVAHVTVPAEAAVALTSRAIEAKKVAALVRYAAFFDRRSICFWEKR